ncbi:MAG: hypothetical protein A2V98_19925 [Planctomycetes bacterium RBG_16_64_12]|nr:MAG: hypothetical protein A2V98_19925 [Planctomycetes bacterium RBG_16_64_12]
MGGFRDLLALLLGWKSASPGADPPYRAAVGRVWRTGAQAGRPYVAGQRAGRVFTTGPLAGQIHG